MGLTLYLYYGDEEQFLESDQGEVFSKNITHNLTEMAEADGCYRSLWRPDAKIYACR